MSLTDFYPEDKQRDLMSNGTYQRRKTATQWVTLGRRKQKYENSKMEFICI